MKINTRLYLNLCKNDTVFCRVITQYQVSTGKLFGKRASKIAHLKEAFEAIGIGRDIYWNWNEKLQLCWNFLKTAIDY